MPGSSDTERRWAQAKAIIGKALDLDIDARKAFLDKACAGDEALRREIESLLAHEDDGFLEPQESPQQQLGTGTQLGPYVIDLLVGVGGMGEVYRATDTRLDRTVAIKVLPGHLAGSESRRQRFEREAKAISQLNHPNICTLYDIGNEDGVDYLVMEYIEGETLSKRLDAEPLPIETALDYATQIASGLNKAHEAGIVHRDLKPGNVMLTRSGVKLLDFGLAKQVQGEVVLTPGRDRASSQNVPAESTGHVTQHGMLLGTVPYMSPEQAAGQPVSHLSDQFSFGAVLYEMLCGEQPFRGDSAAATRERILGDAPISMDKLRPEIDSDLVAIVDRCLQKQPDERYESTGDLLTALRQYQEKVKGRRGLGVRRRPALMSLAVLFLVVAASAWLWLRDDVVRWLERETIAQAEQLIESGELYDAYRLIHEIEQRIPGDDFLRGMLERFTLPVNIATDPPGAEVLVSAYEGDGPWLPLGETPLEGVRIPYALMRWKISKPGFETFVGAPFGTRPFTAFAGGFALDPSGSRPQGMVRIPGGPYQRLGFPPVSLNSYWLDTHEVTNREFKRFVDAGGYDEVQYWDDALAGEPVSRAEILAQLVDSSGVPGPAGWSNGAFDNGQADFPVGGVSWYEAAAYCRFAGKELPTLFHWSAAAIQDQVSATPPASNFGGQGPAPVGSHAGLSDFGNYDLAGNVKEWVWNEANSGRYILGGAWSDPSYTYRVDADSSPPESREVTHGFRCARYEGDVDDALQARYVSTFDQGGDTPASEEVFNAYRRMYAYDRSELDATVDKVDESSPHWRKETVSFAAAYGGERVIAHLFLPRDVEPPYQAIVWVPGNDAFLLPPGGALASRYLFDFIPRSGRALIYPVYKGTYERRVPFSFSPNEWRDLIVAWYKDLGRTVDYLNEREDFDTEKLAYYGFSAGGFFGPVFTAVDDRFKANVIIAGGLKGPFTPEVNPVNFASRSSVPTLMINGREDFLNPLATSQLPLFNLLGAEDQHKRHVLLEGGHIVSDRLTLMEEVLGWLDLYLGPVD